MPEILKMRNYCMKKSPRTVQVRGELVPVAGIEPARGISPMDFEFCTLSGTWYMLVDDSGFCYTTSRT